MSTPLRSRAGAAAAPGPRNGGGAGGGHRGGVARDGPDPGAAGGRVAGGRRHGQAEARAVHRASADGAPTCPPLRAGASDVVVERPERVRWPHGDLDRSATAARRPAGHEQWRHAGRDRSATSARRPAGHELTRAALAALGLDSGDARDSGNGRRRSWRRRPPLAHPARQRAEPALAAGQTARGSRGSRRGSPRRRTPGGDRATASREPTRWTFLRAPAGAGDGVRDVRG